MSSYVGAELRRLVITRADGLCEYCLIHQNDTYLGCAVDHIISVKHGGPTTANNLAYACVACNRAKGSDIGSLVPRTGNFIRFFNPRTDIWAEHFRFEGVIIRPLRDIANVTAHIFGVNAADRLLERDELHIIGRFPSDTALARVSKPAS